ncbi:MAG: hypothetical protein PHX72_00300 [Candidatus Shapirobacteria bacterium]|nr:hypothetical protein [Candidatus Shapirobacteria bacterium]
MLLTPQVNYEKNYLINMLTALGNLSSSASFILKDSFDQLLDLF